MGSRQSRHALHYAKLTGAPNKAHADCLRIITRSEIRMAREIDAARERGEVQTAGGDRKSIIVRTSDNAPASITDLGLDRRRVAEWRDLADAGEDAVDEAIETASRSAKESGRRRHLASPANENGRPGGRPFQSSGSDGADHGPTRPARVFQLN
jgi:hypothetical protein